MASSLFYRQNCPACGRGLQVRVNYLGKAVQCQHCQADFVACQPGNAVEASQSGLALIARADELLKAVEEHRARAAERQTA
ncbi:MAG: response regulator [Lacipirellulaceae bacterium]